MFTNNYTQSIRQYYIIRYHFTNIISSLFCRSEGEDREEEIDRDPEREGVRGRAIEGKGRGHVIEGKGRGHTVETDQDVLGHGVTNVGGHETGGDVQGRMMDIGDARRAETDTTRARNVPDLNLKSLTLKNAPCLANHRKS